ncbi:hypothetical protein, partial [Azospirillum sp. TSO22-1]|uniref:hypothetical protein n=1 Tax=Azospirillum sp. TSO22-1 TaxID=716789 RepID=UPI001B3BEB93
GLRQGRGSLPTAAASNLHSVSTDFRNGLLGIMDFVRYSRALGVDPGKWLANALDALDARSSEEN